jgi:hypothetical protein
MIYQNDPGIVPDAQHYSCRFNVIARAREVLAGRPWTASQYNAAWEGARNAGIISGDLNGDGDYDDPGEDEILNDQRLFDYLGVPLRAVSLDLLGLPIKLDDRGIARVAPTASPLDSARYWVLERWVWRIGHFIQGDGTGKRPAIWDPIKNGSATRANGKIESLRVFLITA